MHTHVSEFEKEYTKAKSRLAQLNNISGIIDSSLKANNTDDVMDAAMAFSIETENLMMISRQLPLFIGNPSTQQDMPKRIMEIMDIKIGFTDEDWFAVSLPALLPKKKSGQPKYIQESLRLVLEDYFAKNDFLLIDDCVIATCNIYKSDKESIWRDYDNIEHKAVLDVLASFVLVDDSPVFCGQLFDSFFGNEDATAIYFIPRDEMDIWLQYMASDSLPDIYIE